MPTFNIQHSAHEENTNIEHSTSNAERRTKEAKETDGSRCLSLSGSTLEVGGRRRKTSRRKTQENSIHGTVWTRGGVMCVQKKRSEMERLSEETVWDFLSCVLCLEVLCLWGYNTPALVRSCWFSVWLLERTLTKSSTPAARQAASFSPGAPATNRVTPGRAAFTAAASGATVS